MRIVSLNRYRYAHQSEFLRLTCLVICFFSPLLSWGKCEGLESQDPLSASLCHSLHAALGDANSEKMIEDDLMALPVHQALQDLLQGGDCQSLKSNGTPFEVCKLIERGFNDDQCDTPSTSLVNGSFFCKFGNYIRHNHLSFYLKRNKALILRYFDKIVPQNTPHREKTVKLSARLYHALILHQSFSNEINSNLLLPSQFANSLIPLVNKIETSREKLDVNQTYSLDSSFSYKKLQNKSIEVYYFGMPLGRGAYKNVYLGFEYDAETLFARSQIHRKQMRVSRFVALEALIRKRVEGIDSARLQFFNLSAYDEIGTYETYSNRSFFSFDLQKFWTFLKANQIESYEGSPYLQMNTVISHSFLQALDILHRGWIHFRDIKPDNVLLNYSDSGEISVALTDFDLSTDTHPHGGLVDYDPNGAPLFHSPEYIQEWRDSIGKNTRTFNNNLKNDVWAAGLTLWSLHQQNWVEINPALGINEDRDLWFDWLTKINTFDQVKSTFSMPFDTKTASDSFSFEFLIRWMLEPDPLKRPSASEALAKVIEIETKPNSKPEPYFSFQASSFLSDQLNPYAMKKQVKK